MPPTSLTVMKLQNQNVNRTWNDVDGVHHAFDIWQISERHFKIKICCQCEVHLFFGELLNSDEVQKKKTLMLNSAIYPDE